VHLALAGCTKVVALGGRKATSVLARDATRQNTSVQLVQTAAVRRLRGFAGVQASETLTDVFLMRAIVACLDQVLVALAAWGVRSRIQ